MEMQSLNVVLRDRDHDGHDGDGRIKQLKLIGVRPFTYSMWKLMDDICTEKN